MRKVILSQSVSLDGFIEGPNREIDWHRVDGELHRYFNDELGQMGAFLSGRVTWELMAEYWPTADQDPDAPTEIREFAGIWRDTAKVVWSRTLVGAGWNTTVLREVDPEQIRAMKAEPGGDLVLSGADLAAAFLRLGLVDECRIYVHPVLIGVGKPLFPAVEGRVGLYLLGTREFGNGVVLLHYRVGGPGA